MDSSTKRGIPTTKVAARLGVTPATVRRWCKAGFGFRLGGHWRVSENRISEIERNLSAGGTGMPSCPTPQQ